MDKIEFETYEKFGDYEVRNMTSDKPRAFNAMVKVARYKVTIEKVSTVEEDHEAIQKLWENSDNYHNYSPIKNFAKSIGYDVVGDFGANLKLQALL